MEKLNEGDVSSCDTEIEVLQKLTPHVKSKHGKLKSRSSLILWCQLSELFPFLSSSDNPFYFLAEKTRYEVSQCLVFCQLPNMLRLQTDIH